MSDRERGLGFPRGYRIFISAAYLLALRSAWPCIQNAESLSSSSDSSAPESEPSVLCGAGRGADLTACAAGPDCSSSVTVRPSSPSSHRGLSASRLMTHTATYCHTQSALPPLSLRDLDGIFLFSWKGNKTPAVSILKFLGGQGKIRFPPCTFNQKEILLSF